MNSNCSFTLLPSDGLPLCPPFPLFLRLVRHPHTCPTTTSRPRCSPNLTTAIPSFLSPTTKSTIRPTHNSPPTARPRNAAFHFRLFVRPTSSAGKNRPTSRPASSTSTTLKRTHNRNSSATASLPPNTTSSPSFLSSSTSSLAKPPTSSSYSSHASRYAALRLCLSWLSLFYAANPGRVTHITLYHAGTSRHCACHHRRQGSH